ncbi:MAG: SUMF1/EgtB/PvdO family nonheme iron enzyme [Bacteroidales bacterium]|nr:SUMF1/EgtB/PvdO family nonheme iron enzyme [Bacteroidales bacterium]
MKNICLLLIWVGLSVIGQAMPLWSAKDYYEKGIDRFRAGEYQKAADDFEYASFKWDDATVSIDSVKYMRQLAIDCKIHKDSGDVMYEHRLYVEAYKHYEFVCKHNLYDSQCREMMGVCMRKGNKGAFANMVMMEPSHFKMGRNGGPANEQPCHVVHLTPYYIDKSEVSNAEFALFLNIKGIYSKDGNKRMDVFSPKSHIKYDKKTGWFSVEKGYDNYPVLGVTWYGAHDYALWVGKSLPTEAQWEYAFGDAKENDGDYYHNVGNGTPNKFGIYGMSDNGREWVEDWYSDTAYECSDLQNPEQHEILEYKSIRGGQSLDDDFNPATFRDYEPPTYSGGNIGFRCVKNITHNK